MHSHQHPYRALLIAFVSCCCLAGTFVQAQESKRLYQWTDEKGVVHVTDSVQNVPEKYRPRTTQTEQSSSGSGAAARQPQGAAGGSAAAPAAANEEMQKAQWQQRMIDAKLKLQSAEEKARQLEQRKSELQSRWGSAGAALPPQEAIEEMKQVNSELSRAQQEVDQARNVVNNVIPDEARRAGVPPGWLREVE